MVQMDLFTKHRVTDVEKLMVTKGDVGEGINWEIGIGRDRKSVV